jgi:hypothetical protein
MSNTETTAFDIFLLLDRRVEPGEALRSNPDDPAIVEEGRRPVVKRR